MKPTPKPRAVRPMKLFMRDSQVFEGHYLSSEMLFETDRPVLVINLSPESVEALIVKALSGLNEAYGKERATTAHMALAALSAIGIKPARVAKRKKAK